MDFLCWFIILQVKFYFIFWEMGDDLEDWRNLQQRYRVIQKLGGLQSMVILDTLTTPDHRHVLAVNRKGHLLLWDLKSSLEHEQSESSTTGVYNPLARLRLQQGYAIKLQSLSPTNLMIVSPESVAITTYAKILSKAGSAAEETIFDDFSTSIPNSVLSSTSDYFNIVKQHPTDAQKLFIGCASGSVIEYDIQRNSTIAKMQTQNTGLGLSVNYQDEAVTGLGVNLTNSRIIAGNGKGSLNILDMNTLKVEQTLSHQGKTTFSSIKTLQIVENSEVFVCHLDYITKWNLLINGLVCSYDPGFECQTMLADNNQLLVGGTVPEILRISLSQSNSYRKWDTSFNCCFGLRKINNSLYMGCGTGKLVDIYGSLNRVLSLSM